MDINAVNIIKQNINLAREAACCNASLKLVAVVSGSSSDRENWQTRLAATKELLFNSGTTLLSLEEKTGSKTRAGNFLGTLLAFRFIREYAADHGLDFKMDVILLGMIFGRGERISPFTQIEGNRKPAILVNTGFTCQEGRMPLTAIEESLFYFVPVGRYLERGGFRGILDKWGDETEIPSIDLSCEPALSNAFAEYDLIKFVSVVKITPELARQKDWVVFDEDENMLAQLSRKEPQSLIAELAALGIQPAADGEYYAGISLGPVAVTYDVLELAAEIFSSEIEAPGVYFDFDPYFMMAICMADDEAAWRQLAAQDRNLQHLLQMVPDFFGKAQSLKTLFREKYGRSLKIKILNLGAEVYWADIGQHKAMGSRFFSLAEDSYTGEIARYLENIEASRDQNNNLLINTEISPDVRVTGSVIINSRITGRGEITGSVIKESVLHNPLINRAFAVHCHRPAGALVMQAGSGLYKSIGKSELVLESGQRGGTLLTAASAIDLFVHEDTDLREKALHYNQPIPGNAISFLEAYNLMSGVSMEELQARRERLIAAVNSQADLQEGNS